MNTNEYYILAANKIKMVEHQDVVEDTEFIRWNNDKTKFVCKTKQGLKKSKGLTPYTSFNQDEILKEMSKPEWNPID